MVGSVIWVSGGVRVSGGVKVSGGVSVRWSWVCVGSEWWILFSDSVIVTVVILVFILTIFSNIVVSVIGIVLVLLP